MNFQLTPATEARRLTNNSNEQIAKLLERIDKQIVCSANDGKSAIYYGRDLVLVYEPALTIKVEAYRPAVFTEVQILVARNLRAAGYIVTIETEELKVRSDDDDNKEPEFQTQHYFTVSW